MGPPLKKRINASMSRENGNGSPSLHSAGSSFDSDLSSEQNPRGSRPPSRVSFLLPNESNSTTTTNENTSVPVGKAREGDFQTPQTKRSRIGTSAAGSVSVGHFPAVLAKSSSSKANRLLSEPLVDTPYPQLYYGNLGANRPTVNSSPHIQLSRGAGRGAGCRTSSSNQSAFAQTVRFSGPVPQQFVPQEPRPVSSLEWSGNLALAYPETIFSLAPLNSNLDALASIALTPITWPSGFFTTRVNDRTGVVDYSTTLVATPSVATSKTVGSKSAEDSPECEAESKVASTALDGKAVKVQKGVQESVVHSSANVSMIEPTAATSKTQASNDNLKSTVQEKSKDQRTPLQALTPVSCSFPNLELDPVIFPGTKPQPSLEAATGCICKRSKCLKLYCKCFQTQTYCNPVMCKCKECNNNMVYDVAGGTRKTAIADIMKRRADAFDSRPTKKTGEGCACKKNRCLKKYCDCFTIGVACTDSRCSCKNCYNGRTRVNDAAPKVQTSQAVAVTGKVTV